MINEIFTERMKKLLGNEYEQFMKSLESPPVRGLRVNGIKISPERFFEETKLNLERLSYVTEGAILKDDVTIGNTPEHQAGMIYMQDPGAMSALSALDVCAGWWVIDLCAAPGGKTTQAAAKIGSEGFILANEYVPKRAKILVSNMERLGVMRGMVTSMDTGTIANMFSSVFDLVICDAPCSGEGMFRKSDAAEEEWSAENVLLCTSRQAEILENAKGLVKSGGYLLYSTCTYSEEENEGTVAAFLGANPEFECVAVRDELIKVTSSAIMREGYPEGVKHARRFYPHVSRGEGQFVALMRKKSTGDMPIILYKDSTKPLSKNENEIVSRFFREALVKAPDGKIRKHNDNIVLIPHDCPVPANSVFMSGILLGEIRGQLLYPSHQFFSVFGNYFKLCENLLPGDERIEKYLAGEETQAKEASGSGWCAVKYNGAPLGGGKISGGRIKNHYPKGLRIKK